MKHLLLILALISCFSVQAQTDSIQELDEVILSDVKLKRYTSGFKVEVLNDSVLASNTVSMTDLLSFNSNIYFKENGKGMVSSPSFRGTNASHTAVIWNGININSQLNGQVDFNTIAVFGYDNITIRSGGGSVQYGSGAIGGSVHLNNDLEFGKHFNNTLNLAYGSFNTKLLQYRLKAGEKQWTADFGFSWNTSDNDYPYLGTEKFNQNGEYKNLGVFANFGYAINKRHSIKLHNQSFIGDRNFSGSLVSPSRSKYIDNNYRTLLQWVFVSDKLASTLSTAYLVESFKYFENKNSNNYSSGEVLNSLVKHNLDYKFSNRIRFSSILEYNNFRGSGSSFGDPERDALSATVLAKHQLTNRFVYGVNLRKDFTSGFKSPFVASVDAAYLVSQEYKLKLNASKNFRVPTFNDLYWQPGGNPNLKPESSYQVDLGHDFTWNHFNFLLNTFYIDTNDMIQWKPINGNTWSPININEVEQYGLELKVDYKQKFDRHSLNAEAHYSYTVSQDKQTKRQLIYVPLNKGGLNLGYAYSQFGLYYQQLFNGEVSVIGGDLEGYNVANAGVRFQSRSNRNVGYSLDLKINNIYNAYYEVVPVRPMPGRYYNVKLTLNL